MEVLLSGALFGLFVTVLISAVIYGQETARIAGMHRQAASLAEEGLEVVRNIRDESFSNLTDGTYGIALVGNQWSLLGTSDTIDAFTRQITISTVDTHTKQAIANVVWPQNLQRTGSISLVSYFANWAALGIGSWGAPSQEASVNISENQDAVKIQTVGNYAYVIRNGGNHNFVIIDLSTPSTPNIIGSLTLNGNPVNLAMEGNYAYVSSEDNSSELQIISVNNPENPVLVGTYNAPGNANAAGITVVSSTVYLGRVSSGENEFYIVNTANPSNPILVGSLNLSDTVNDVVKNGLYVYLGSDSNSGELQIVSVLNPSLPTLAGTYNISGNTDALSVVIINTTTLAIGAADNSLYLLNIASPTTPTLHSSVDTGGRVYGISLGNANNYAFVATGSGSAEFQVIDMTTVSAPTLFGSVNLSSSITGIAYSNSLDRAIVASNGNNEEVIILQPQ